MDPHYLFLELLSLRTKTKIDNRIFSGDFHYATTKLSVVEVTALTTLLSSFVSQSTASQ